MKTILHPTSNFQELTSVLLLNLKYLGYHFNMFCILKEHNHWRNEGRFFAKHCLPFQCFHITAIQNSYTVQSARSPASVGWRPQARIPVTFT